jgi:signal peptidase I
MSRRSLTRAVGSALGLATLAAAVLCLWPVQLGGWTAYAVINGTSMEPGLHTGDLVITRKHSEYAVGDAVLYRSALLDSNVFHRIVAVEDGKYTFRGDNRSENDPEVVAASRIRGGEWIAIPNLGSALDWLRQPFQLAVLAFLIVFAMLFGGREIARRRRPGEPKPVHAEPEPRSASATVTASARAVVIASAVALVLFGALSAVAWTRDTSVSTSVVGGYAHTGTFTYEAEARPGVAYPDSVVTTGQPIFTSLSESATVSFTYRLDSRERSDVRGSIALDLRLEDPTTKWSRTLPLEATTPFTGTNASVSSTLDLAALEKLIANYGKSTGTNVTTAVVSLVPHVDITGHAGANTLADTFAPELPFTLDPIVFKLSDASSASPELAKADAPPVSPLLPRVEGTGTVVNPAQLSAGALSVDVDQARSLGLIGLALSAIALVIAGGLLARRLGGSERDRIDARYGSKIVAATAVVPDGRWISDLASIEELMRVADAYDRVVLRVDENGGDAYLVDDGIAVYRFRPARAGALGAPRAFPAHGR